MCVASPRLNSNVVVSSSLSGPPGAQNLEVINVIVFAPGHGKWVSHISRKKRYGSSSDSCNGISSKRGKVVTGKDTTTNRQEEEKLQRETDRKRENYSDKQRRKL